MFNYVIYQTWNRDWIYMSWEYASKHGFNLDDYEKVYEGKIDAESEEHALAKLWQIFNIEHPADYKARSLSMSDLVKVNDTLYYCDRFGWAIVEQ